MAKYKVLQPFRDKYTKEEYEKDDIIELTEERANEAIENLKKHDGEFLELVEDEKEKETEQTEETEQIVEVDGIDAEEMTVPQLKEALDQLEIEYKSSAKRNELLELLEGAQEDTEQEGD